MRLLYLFRVEAYLRRSLNLDTFLEFHVFGTNLHDRNRLLHARLGIDLLPELCCLEDTTLPPGLDTVGHWQHGLFLILIVRLLDLLRAIQLFVLLIC